jgi:hypothetical protein
MEGQPLPAAPPPASEEGDKWLFDIYGFVMLDSGYDFGHVGDRSWEDTLRPTKLPAFEDQHGEGGRTFFGVRQTRFGAKAEVPTDYGQLKTKFEFEMFGTGADAGQTTIRLRHAVGDLGNFRVGQTWSPFMDIDVFPNSVEYWGPNGMAFFRNVQVAWMPVQGDSRVTVALERPGASPDTGIYADRNELTDVRARFPAPDVSAEGRYGGKWGYVELSGILRYMRWDDMNPDAVDLDGHAVGWGAHVSSNLKLDPVVLRMSALYGAGIQNYMNDAPADIGVEMNPGDPRRPIEGKALPILGLVAFADINWDKSCSTAVGWSYVWIDNSDGQAPDAFHAGHYALINFLWKPVPDGMLGPEFQFGRRENNSDGFDVNDFRIQFSAKYNFGKTFKGK